MVLSACAHVSPRVAAGAPENSLETYISTVRRMSIAARPKGPAVPSLEAQNQELRDALSALAERRTVERHLRVADAYRAAGILDLAYDHYAAARDMNGREPAAYDGLARIWRDWGAPELGLADASRALYYAPRSPAAYNTFGTLLDALAQPEEAHRAFERAVALDPGAAYAWTNLCYQAFKAGDLAGARARCERAVQLDPQSAPAHNNLALVHAAQGDVIGAEAELAAVGDRAAQRFNVGILMSASGRYADAVRAFAEAERLRPGWALAADRARQARRLAMSQGGAAAAAAQ
jgi:tetratricopeptide (TPR) repeat protein